MVDLSGGSDGPLEHAFSNTVFIIPGIIVIGLSVTVLSQLHNMPFAPESGVGYKYLKKMADEVSKPTLDIGGAITQKLRESIEKMDVMTVLQKMVATTPEDEQSEEIRDKLKGVLEQFNSMTKEEKLRFTAQIKDGLVNKLSLKFNDANLNLEGLEDVIKSAVMTRLYLVGAGVLLFIIIIVFFGYKLYKSIKDKEKKKQEKKMAKQMKKKK